MCTLVPLLNPSAAATLGIVALALRTQCPPRAGPCPIALMTLLSHSRGMAAPIRDSANDNQLCRPSVGDSLRATAARADIGPRLAQMLRDAAALVDVLDRKIAASEAAQAEVVHSVQELIDALERSISRLNMPIGQSRR